MTNNNRPTVDPRPTRRAPVLLSGPVVVSRRTVLAGVVAVGAAGALVACGSGSDAPTSTGPVTLPASDVPVGGGKILTDSRVVVTQPTAGTYKAFSAVCTHQGCLVQSVENNVISCPCHSSQFSATDGAVRGGPAPSPLPAKVVTLSGTTLNVT